MNWEQLIAIARLLAEPSQTGETRGRPQQAQLCKAISITYYAMFHALAGSNADLLIGSSRQFRALHFGITFIDLQALRHLADYDPTAIFTRSETIGAIERAEDAIVRFLGVSAAERRELAARVLFRRR